LTTDRRTKDQSYIFSVRLAEDKSINIIKSCDGKGINTDGTTVNFNSSSGACAVNLAYYMGAKKIILVGFDMRWIGGKSNWHVHPIEKSHKPYTNLIAPFHRIAVDASHLGLEIVNSTPNSAIKEFPYVNFEEIYESIA